MEAQPHQETKKCPMCGEDILAVAVKCKHCGELLAGPSRKEIASPSPGRRKKVLLVGAAVLGVAVLGGLGWLAYSWLPETKLWVSMHKDVEWHRRWQDAHFDDNGSRVADLYRGLAAASPQDGNLKYLALRAAPRGQRTFDEFREAAKAFDKNPWMLFGLASYEEEEGNSGDACDLRLKAVELFGRNVPGIVLGSTAVGLARQHDVELLKELYVKHRDAILSSRDASWYMARAAFIRGDLEGMVKWEEFATSLGEKSTVFRTKKDRAEAIGLRPDLVGVWRNAPSAIHVEVVDYTAEADGSGTRLTLRLKITSNSWRDLNLWLGKAAIVPTNGGKIETSSNRTVDIPPFKHIEVGLPFIIPAGTAVEELVINTGLVDVSTRIPVVVRLGLSSDGKFKVEDVIRPDSVPTLAPPTPAPATQPTAAAASGTK